VQKKIMERGSLFKEEEKGEGKGLFPKNQRERSRKTQKFREWLDSQGRLVGGGGGMGETKESEEEGESSSNDKTGFGRKG